MEPRHVANDLISRVYAVTAAKPLTGTPWSLLAVRPIHVPGGWRTGCWGSPEPSASS